MEWIRRVRFVQADGDIVLVRHFNSPATDIDRPASIAAIIFPPRNVNSEGFPSIITELTFE
jgi:hypothetical protein